MAQVGRLGPGRGERSTRTQKAVMTAVVLVAVAIVVLLAAAVVGAVWLALLVVQFVQGYGR